MNVEKEEYSVIWAGPRDRYDRIISIFLFIRGGKMMKKIILIDGSNLLFRMFYGIPSSIKNTKGKEIRGLIGFVGSLKKIVAEFKPYSLVVIFDSETSKSANLQIDIEYKANRIDYTGVLEEENPFSQLPLIKKALKYLEIFYVEIENYEADDYIASIVSQKESDEYEYIIVSTDSDFIQLVNKQNYLYVPRGKRSILYDEEEVIKKYDVLPSQYVLFKSLIGDKSDNIKGITGIGNKTASKILKYTSIQEFIVAEPNSRFAKLLLENRKKIIKNEQLITMNKNLDISSVSFNPLIKKIYDDKTYYIVEKIGER